ncbi:MAG: hydrogenase maturation protease [Methylacidiphilales bacterium]|nr:hydrogenase maturation protease [Candidatus Methylacidiphilales bacterium]
MTNKRVLIIGYGNPLRGDDGLGWEVAGRLAACITDPSVAIMAVQQLTPELSEPIHAVDLVIFVDASNEGEPGTWKYERVMPASAHAPSLGHHFDISGLLAYTGALFPSCPGALVVSVAAESFACHENLSHKVEAVLPAVVGHIRRQIAALHSSKEPLYA